MGLLGNFVTTLMILWESATSIVEKPGAVRATTKMDNPEGLRLVTDSDLEEVARIITKFSDGDQQHILPIQAEIRRVAGLLGFYHGHRDNMSTLSIWSTLTQVYPATDETAGVVWQKTDRGRHGPDSPTATSICGTVGNIRLKTSEDFIRGKSATN